MVLANLLENANRETEMKAMQEQERTEETPLLQITKFRSGLAVKSIVVCAKVRNAEMREKF